VLLFETIATGSALAGRPLIVAMISMWEAAVAGVSLQCKEV